MAFRLYCRTQYGRLNQSNPEIIALSEILNRTPSAIVMKACNFASLDPAQRKRGVKGLVNRGRIEGEIWEQFSIDSEAIAVETEEAYEHFKNNTVQVAIAELSKMDSPTELLRQVRVRCVQSFFRNAVMASYDNRCAITGIQVTSLLNASHIIPWSISPSRRADPKNGLCLNVMHDRAFDRGLIAFDKNLKMLLSPELRKQDCPQIQSSLFQAYENKQLRLPSRFKPDEAALAYHRQNIFLQG